jgi:transcriptional regulator with XRE-family HTH domain
MHRSIRSPGDESEIRRSVGARLKLARMQQSLSQEEVAEQLGIPRPSISNIESGKRNIELIELISFATMYGQPLEFFFAEILNIMQLNTAVGNIGPKSQPVAEQLGKNQPLQRN